MTGTGREPQTSVRLLLASRWPTEMERVRLRMTARKRAQRPLRVDSAGSTSAIGDYLFGGHRPEAVFFRCRTIRLRVCGNAVVDGLIADCSRSKTSGSGSTAKDDLRPTAAVRKSPRKQHSFDSALDPLPRNRLPTRVVGAPAGLADSLASSPW